MASGFTATAPESMRQMITGTAPPSTDHDAPATFDRYYDELGAMFGQHPPGSDGFTAAFDELACRYGLITHWDDMPDLVARFGLGQVPR